MKKNKNDESRFSKILSVAWKGLLSLAFVLPALFAFAMQRVLSQFPSAVEFVYSTSIFRWISTPISFITSIIPLSLTEISAYAAIPLAIALIVILIQKLRRTDSKKRVIFRAIKITGWVLSVSYLLFMLLLGFNYARMPLSDTLGIKVQARSADDLESVCYILLEKTNETRAECTEKNGVMILNKGKTNALKKAYLGYDAISGVYPVFKGSPRRAKAVLSSHLWSYTGITGMYFPFYVEANVNTDIPQAFIPYTILHELAHTRGIAREDEANFSAFLSGIHHPDPDFIYSSYLHALIQTSNALYSTDQKTYGKLMDKLSEGVRNDLSENNRYWKQFEGPVQEVSTSVNNAYLQTNMQDDGVRSYGRVVDLILGYYLS